MLGAGDRARDKGQRDIALAHTTAAFGRAKKLERLGRYLTAAAAKPQTIAERLIAWRDAGAPVTITVTKRGA